MAGYGKKALRRELARDEGRRKKPYRDTRGKLTIGVGWNLDANGLPDDIIDRLLNIGIAQAEDAVGAIYPSWRRLTRDRQRVLLNMAFNLGQGRLRAFRRMWAAIRRRDYAAAADEMLDSRWASQVGARAQRLARRMRGRA